MEANPDHRLEPRTKPGQRPGAVSGSTNLLLWLLIAAAALASRLAYLHIVWVEEGYPLAAAQQLLRGATLYRDIWFDKPPLFPATYLLWGAQTGLPLRLAGAAFILLAACAAAHAARSLWSPREANWAAALTAFFLIFETHSATLALTPDLLTVPLHFAAIACAATGSPLLAGLAAGLALCFNSKAILILAACALWAWRSPARLALGFALPVSAAALLLAAQGALPAHIQQVWLWGAAYSRDTFLPAPWLEGLRRTLNWSAFHLALLAAALYAFFKQRDWRFPAWAALSLAAAWLGFRFFPRYFFHLLPALALPAARGFALLPARRAALAAALLLAAPALRFGPRYLQVAQHHPWSDLAMHDSSQQAAALLRAHANPSDTLLVWGYRPELYPLSRLRPASPFLDAQPLSGVLADRHLTNSTPTFPTLAAANRAALTAAPRPTWIADGLSPYNPNLDPRLLLPQILKDYQPAARCPGFILYRLRP